MSKLIICPVCKQNGQRSVSTFWITQLPTPKIEGGYFDQEGNWQQPTIGFGIGAVMAMFGTKRCDIFGAMPDAF